VAKGDLTTKQRLFLDALSTGTRSQGEQGTGMADADAARTVGVAMSSVYRWKNIPKFWGEYQVVVGEAEETLEDAMALGAEDRQQLAADQAEALMRILPSVVQEHIHIALRADKDADRLRAIEKLYAAVGFGKDEAPPVAKQNRVFLQMLNLMAPQVAAEAARRGLPVSSTVKEVISADFALTMARLERESARDSRDEGEEDEEE